MRMHHHTRLVPPCPAKYIPYISNEVYATNVPRCSKATFVLYTNFTISIRAKHANPNQRRSIRSLFILACS